MTADITTIYGIQVVPHYDKNGTEYGMFEGVVISCSLLDFDKIQISKMIKRDNGYFVDSWINIPYEEVIEHGKTSGQAKAEFLICKAKELAKEGEKIAICDTLVPHLKLKDVWWENFKKLNTTSN